MLTVESLFGQVANPKQILASVKEILTEVDPHFSLEEQKYKQAAQKLLKSIDGIRPSAEEYLEALEVRYGYELLYIGWQGFQFNLDCFNSPVNALMLRGDFEDLHRERRLHTLPHTHQPQKIINTFDDALKESNRLELTDDISSFYCIIETEGYKIAHYFGFLFADRFLPLVEPGYAPDSVITNTYSLMLSQATGFNLFSLENEVYQRFFRRAENE